MLHGFEYEYECVIVRAHPGVIAHAAADSNANMNRNLHQPRP